MDGAVLRGPKTPLWLCSCGCSTNWASRLLCRDCGRRCSGKVESNAQRAHLEALKGRPKPKPSVHQEPRGAWARDLRASHFGNPARDQRASHFGAPPWQQEKYQRQDSELVAMRKQIEELTASRKKAQLEVLSDLKAELQKQGNGEQATSCVDAVVAKHTEQPKPRSLTALQGQRKKLEGQHQKAIARVAELEEQRVQLDKQINGSKELVAELKGKLEAADTEIETRHADGVLGDGLKGLNKVLEQFKATAGDSQAVLDGLAQLQAVVKKEQETLDEMAAPAAAPEAAPGAAPGGGGRDDPAEGVEQEAKVAVPEDLLDDLMADAPEDEEPEQRRKRIKEYLEKHAKRQRV